MFRTWRQTWQLENSKTGRKQSGASDASRKEIVEPQNGGYYLLRINWIDADPKTLWRTYIQLTEMEDAFRTTKHNLGMRPVYHQTQERVQAHILVCFLSLAMWRTLQQWMKASGLGTAPRKLLEERREIKSLDVLLPTRDKHVRLRVVPKM